MMHTISIKLYADSLCDLQLYIKYLGSYDGDNKVKISVLYECH